MACCHIGRGNVYIQKHGVGCPTTLVPWTTPNVAVGNTENLQLDIQENVIEQKDYTNAAGGVDCTYTEIQSVDLIIDTKCFDAKNLRLALFGDSTEVAAAAVVDEPHRVNSADDFIAMDKKYDIDATVTVTDDPNTTTYVEGTDYSLTPNGIKIIDGGAIVATTDILISYAGLAYDNIEAIVNPSDYYTVTFDGINASENTPFYFKYYKVRFNPSSVGFIGDEFSTVNLTAKVLKWECVTASATKSPYGILRV